MALIVTTICCGKANATKEVKANETILTTATSEQTATPVPTEAPKPTIAPISTEVSKERDSATVKGEGNLWREEGDTELF